MRNVPIFAPNGKRLTHLQKFNSSPDTHVHHGTKNIRNRPATLGLVLQAINCLTPTHFSICKSSLLRETMTSLLNLLTLHLGCNYPAGWPQTLRDQIPPPPPQCERDPTHLSQAYLDQATAAIDSIGHSRVTSWLHRNGFSKPHDQLKMLLNYDTTDLPTISPDLFLTARQWALCQDTNPLPLSPLVALCP